MMEFAIIVVVLGLMALGVVDFGRMISLSNRVAAVARESGRMIYAMNYSTATNDLDAVFDVATNMIAPGNLNTNGKVIINFVQRVPGNLSILSATNNTNDVLIITNRFFFPYSGTNFSQAATNAPNWNSRLPASFTNGSGKFIPFTNNELPVTVEMLKPYDKTSVVEVYHTNHLITPVGALGVSLPTFLYEMAVF